MDDTDKKLLELFDSNVNDLLSHSLVQNKQLKLNLTVFRIREEELKVKRHKIEREPFESLLLRLRRFNNQKDIIYFPRIVNILIKYENNNEDKDALKELKKLFQNKPKYNLLNIYRKGKRYFEEVLFDLYVNGKLFHVDIEKINELKDLSSFSELSITDDMFISAAIKKLNAIIYVKRYMEEKRVLKAN